VPCYQCTLRIEAMIHILIAGANTRDVQAVENALKAPDRQCVSCGTGLKALELAVLEQPDLVILDMELPDLSGLELCTRLRKQASTSQLAILFVCATDTVEDRIAALQAGANDCLGKPLALKELQLRAAVLLQRSSGRNNFKSTELAVGNLRLNLKTFMAVVDGHEAQLTPVEYDLLRYLMLRPGEVISAERLLQEVWRYYPGTGDTAVVRMQVMNLRDKIESDRSRPRYVRTVYRHGYMVTA